MNSLIVNKEGQVILNSKTIDLKSIDSKFLLELFSKALNDEITFSIDESKPISKIFKEIENNSREGSAFRTEYKEALKQIEINRKKLDELKSEPVDSSDK